MHGTTYKDTETHRDRRPLHRRVRAKRRARTRPERPPLPWSSPPVGFRFLCTPGDPWLLVFSVRLCDPCASVFLFVRGYSVRSLSAAARSVSSFLAKQKRRTGGGGWWYRNADVGIDATPCSLVRRSAKSMSFSSVIAE